MQPRIYKTIGIGGTFDHFHKGHEEFIRFASSLAQEVLIGITSEKLTLQKSYSQSIQSYEERRTAVLKFCQRNHIKVRSIELNDSYGPTLEDSKVRAIAVTEETQPGAKLINTLREKLGLRPLVVHVMALVKDENGEPIHSVRIRNGEINRQGIVYENLFKIDVILSDAQRQFFSEPQGEIINLETFKSPKLRPGKSVAVVGDESLETFINNQWNYILGVFDKRRARQDVYSEVIDSLKIDERTSNSPGLISVQLIKSLKSALSTTQKKHVFVEGEEDLATVALVLLLPLGSYVYYGQPDQGIVEIEITEQLKDHFFSAFQNPNLSQN